MFSADDILFRTRQQPFQPFRIVTTTGQTYDVYHPDQASASRRFVTVPTTPTASGVPDQLINVAILHIVEIQAGIPIPSAPGGAPGNGQA